MHRVEFDATAVEGLADGEPPGDWTQSPPPSSTQSLGRNWLARAVHPVLRVPSVLLAEEDVFFLNPRHPAFASFPIARERFFFFDPRLG